MPHLIIDCSRNIAPDVADTGLTASAHAVMLASGLFDSKAIKSRTHISDDFHVGEQGREGSYIHLLIYLMEGRTTEQKQMLAKALFDVVLPHVPSSTSVTVDVRDLTQATYQKRA